MTSAARTRQIHHRRLRLALAALVLTTAAAVAANRGGRQPAGFSEDASFRFARVEYDSEGGPQEAYYVYEGRLWQRWETDYPQADENFLFRLGEITRIRPDPRPRTVRLDDEGLFSFPFLYFCDVGWMRLSDLEANRLGEYLARGGFLWVDDFWGQAEWANFENNMRRVLPGNQWQEIPADHPILRTLFPLEGLPGIPARDFAIAGWPHDPPWIHRQPAFGVEVPHLRGYFDAEDRLLAVATLNTDLGDGWEREGYGQWYFERYSTLAYATGANIVLHALIR